MGPTLATPRSPQAASALRDEQAVKQQGHLGEGREEEEGRALLELNSRGGEVAGGGGGVRPPLSGADEGGEEEEEGEKGSERAVLLPSRDEGA